MVQQLKKIATRMKASGSNYSGSSATAPARNKRVSLMRRAYERSTYGFIKISTSAWSPTAPASSRSVRNAEAWEQQAKVQMREGARKGRCSSYRSRARQQQFKCALSKQKNYSGSEQR